MAHTGGEQVRQNMDWQNYMDRLSGADQITYIVSRGRTKLHMTCGARDFKKYFKNTLKNTLKNKVATLKNKVFGRVV